MNHYPQWYESTTEEERAHLNDLKDYHEIGKEEKLTSFPEFEWREVWRARHRDDVFHAQWMNEQENVYDQIKIPVEIEPQDGDLLIYYKEQFDRILQHSMIELSGYVS